MIPNLIFKKKSACNGLREGKGGALLGMAFFSQPQKAGAGDRPEGARPKEKMVFDYCFKPIKMNLLKLNIAVES